MRTSWVPQESDDTLTRKAQLNPPITSQVKTRRLARFSADLPQQPQERARFVRRHQNTNCKATPTRPSARRSRRTTLPRYSL